MSLADIRASNRLARIRDDRVGRDLPLRLANAIADGTPIDRADGSVRDLSETEALSAWRAGVALVVRS